MPSAFAPVLAQSSNAPAGEMTRIVWQTPTTTLGWLLLLGGFGLAAAAIVWLQRRDTRELGPFLRGLLLTLRLSALLGLFVIYLNPQERTTREAFQPSRVAVLVDVSGSMQQPSVDPAEVTDETPSRAEVVRELLAESDLIADLRQRHAVSVYPFGEGVAEQPLQLPYNGPLVEQKTEESPVDWEEWTQPVDAATRLGDAVEQVLANRGSRRDVGVVLLTDGAINAGQGVRSPNARAVRDEVKLIAVGVGGTERAKNLTVARLIGPTDVQAGDAFNLTAYLQATGAEGETLEVTLRRGEEDGEVIARETVTLPADGQPIAVPFEDRQTDEGEFVYSVTATLDGIESRDDDNAAFRRVRVFDRPLSVLVIAGGPTRDYRFARSALFRHPSAEIDVWLQSGQPGISQESRELLFEFPDAREKLYQYDVLLSFDADWTQLSDEQISWVTEWVGNEGGGIIAQVGDVYTPTLAGVDERLDPIRVLYPVQLEPVRLSLTTARDRSRIFPFQLTDAGRAADFLQIDTEETGDRGVWDRFRGVFSAYPTAAIKSGATVFAEFPNPLVRGASGPPPLIVEQRYAQGTVLYLGTGELWRLRAIDDDVYDRLWVKLVRRAGQGRSRQGVQRAVWLLDNRDQPLGRTLAIRARVVSQQFTPLDVATLPITIVQPDGTTVQPPVLLQQDARRPTEFFGEYRPTKAGRYELRLTPPGGGEPVLGELRVELPQLEASKLEQDRATLVQLVEETGGAYLTPEEAATTIPELLPAAGQSILVDRQLRDLWDRWWVLAALVGVLGLEWLIRKLVALA